jgi:hypothetical protein
VNSAQIRQQRNAYHDILKQTQEGTMDDGPHAVDGVVPGMPVEPSTARK